MKTSDVSWQNDEYSNIVKLYSLMFVNVNVFLKIIQMETSLCLFDAFTYTTSPTKLLRHAVRNYASQHITAFSKLH